MTMVKIVFTMLAVGNLTLPRTHQDVEFLGTGLEATTYKGVRVVRPLPPASGSTSLLEMKFPKVTSSVSLRVANGSPTTIRGYDESGREIKTGGLPIELKPVEGFVNVFIGAKGIKGLAIESRKELYVESVSVDYGK